jgi:hypothetical protein
VSTWHLFGPFLCTYICMSCWTHALRDEQHPASMIVMVFFEWMNDSSPPDVVREMSFSVTHSSATWVLSVVCLWV